MFNKSNLENGSTLITVPNEHTNAVTVLVLFPVGSRYETSELNGISHFIEHMMFKGTEKRPTTLHISRELDSAGAEYNAYTSKDYTGYYVRIDAKKFDLAMDIVSDMLWNSVFDANEIEREKGVIAEELHMYEDNPIMDIDEVLESQVFAGSPLGWKIGGTPEIIHKFSRDQMVGFRDRFYTPDKMTVVIAGKVPGDVNEQAQKYFGTHEREVGETSYISHEIVETPKVHLKYKDATQAVMALGFPAYSYTDKRLNALTLLHVILGGSMSSRLFIEVRERRGLAYMVKTDISPYHETGAFVVKMGLLPEKCREALEVTLGELNKIRESGVSEEELRQAKDQVRGKITLSLENSSALAEWYAKQWILKGETDTPDERFEKLEGVTVHDIKMVAEDVLGKKYNVAIIGPFKDPSEFEV